jgi:uncharacterized caspase-like protein
MLNRLLAALLFVMIGCASAEARRVALVIGNGAYKTTVGLTNPVPDARAMAAKLSALGFDVVSGYDQDLTAMQRTVGDFARKAIGADLALMFYAGHGIQVRGDNFLIPIDAKFEDETALDFETVPVDFIMRQMSRDVRVRVIILDACRNNPLARSLSRAMGPSRAAAVAEGLAEIRIEDPGEGTVIAFATSPGDVAFDGDTSHSPFTDALLQHIDAPNTPIQNVMTRVTRDVYTVTKQRQRPWVNASLIGEVYLNETAVPAAPAVAGNADTPSETEATGAIPAHSGVVVSVEWDREKTLFEVAAKSGTVEDYRAYLATYPQGQFAGIARNFIARAETGGAATIGPQLAALPSAEAATPADTPIESGAGESTAAAASLAGTAESEQALGWDKPKRREVQVRLELAGQEVGAADGAFGTRTRAGIGAWQGANSFQATGYFTAEQFERLAAQTEAAYGNWKAQAARKPPANSKATKSAARSTGSKKAAVAKKPSPAKKTVATPVKKKKPVATAVRPAPKTAAVAKPAPQPRHSNSAGAAFFGSLIGGGIGITIGGGGY